MTDAGIKWTDYTLETRLQDILKDAEKAEKAALRAGGQLIKRKVKKEVGSTIPGSKRNTSGTFMDKLIDAVRVTKPQDGYVKYHILGVRSKKSGTFRLRFFESSKMRYQTKINGKPLKKKRKIGSLAKFNGFFARGVANSQSQLQPTMQAALEKYIKKAWNG